MLSIGLLSGGYGADELQAAGAFRVYRDAAELHALLDELGIARSPSLRASANSVSRSARLHSAAAG